MPESNDDLTPGWRVMEEWRKGLDPIEGPTWADFKQLGNDIDRELSKKQTLDLRNIRVAEMGRSGAEWIRFKDIMGLLRVQLPNVEVKT